MGHVFAFGLLIFRSYDVFMMFGYKMNKFLKTTHTSNLRRSNTIDLASFSQVYFASLLFQVYFRKVMAIKPDMSCVQKYFDVNQLYGNSYSLVNLNIDGPDEVINNKIKQMQAKEFEEVANTRLFMQKQHFRFKLMEGRYKKTGEALGKKVLIEHVYPDISLNEEFKDFQISDFLPMTEEELADLIIDYKMEEIAETNARNERCCAWVLSHCK